MSGGGDGPDDGEDRRHMLRALELAERGRGRVAPNPMVGAVVVREGAVVGEGWHREHGADHAEVEALRDAGDGARGATVYVNLEPCTHRGKTPPCTEALRDAGVGRVVVGCRDSHPEAGGGAARLREAGVEVTTGVAGREAARLNAPFLWRQDDGGPFVSLKLALSLDARVSRAPGTRTDVTGEEAWARVHRLRAEHRAVLVGRRTAEVDDPRLTARGEVEPRRPPVRVVLDSGLRLDPGSTLARTTSEAPVWVFGAPGADGARRDRLEDAGVRVLEAETADDGEGLRPADVLDRLAAEGVGSVLVEGGGRVAASFLAADRVQRMHLLYAPEIYGPGGVEGFPGPAPKEGEWRPAERAALGPDTLITLESRELRRVIDEHAAGP